MATTAAQAAFVRRVHDILREMDRMSEGSVSAALEQAAAAREHIRDLLLRIPGERFEAGHLRALRVEVDRTIAALTNQYAAAFPGLLERAHALGIDLAEDPFKAAGFLGATASVSTINPAVLAALQRYSADLITHLAAEARRRINGILAQSVMGSLSGHDAITAIAGSLEGQGGVFGSVSARAEAIYRTETNRVFSMATQARMNEMRRRIGGLKKQWINAMDEKVRETHQDQPIGAGMQIVPSDGLFIVGGEYAQYPRDPGLSAGESVNCRCQSVPALDAEAMASLGVPDAAPIIPGDFMAA